ncbi:sigma-70 family RNA polymerase sigma factor [Sedimentibacter hydroxybenzoicus DSM 7310]|uniref:Sigma-70 family RNA polymerase sigma factor n=1 Tax=Sedimentibacter hydroxybenzoicus DSM 7310 TaxID=1123245 RepID=A0A974BID0_SEDHY|nr:sigma-70 family RNA polymerase sigma factor [Sedimentibacter hydroxybenzoicus]NYB73406.1 sigma-70 family RNA polymerase sigma factor [Sedimentibacter hydroxybenzoicus DSM 7310]
MPESKKPESYKKTELLLYNYNSFVKSIEIKEFQIKAIKEISSDKGEKEIRDIEKSICKTKNLIGAIDAAVETLKDDMYFDIIRLRYFEGKTIENMAEHFYVEPSTISRNNNRLIEKLKICLFSDDVIKEIMQ